MSFTFLPNNLQLNIFDFCNLDELRCLSCVSKSFNNNIINDKHYNYWNKRIFLNHKRNIIGLIKNSIIRQLVWQFIYKVNSSLLTYKVEEKIKRLLNLNEVVDITGYDYLIVEVRPLNLCHLLNLEVRNNDLYYHNKKYILNDEEKIITLLKNTDLNQLDYFFIEETINSIIKLNKDKINNLVEIYEKKLDIYMKLSLTKKYFNKFRVGQIVKIINLPSHLYFIPYGGSKQPIKTEKYISEGELGYILPMEHESISYQLSLFNATIFNFKRKHQRTYLVCLKDKIVRLEEQNIISNEKYNLR